MLLVISSILTHYVSTTQYHFEGQAIHEGEAIYEGKRNQEYKPIHECEPIHEDEPIQEGEGIHEGEHTHENEPIPEDERIHEGQAMRHWPTRVARRTSIIFRRLGKVIAAINSLWVVATCLLQFANVFDNCYCNSNVVWLRDHAYIVIALLPSDVAIMKNAWVGALFFAGGTTIIYLVFVDVYINPPLPD